MKQFTLVLAYLTAVLSGVVSAHPGHDGPVIIKHRSDVNLTDGSSSNDTSTAEDHIPIFKTLECDCPPVMCDTRLNAESQCQCKSQALLACYIKSSGGCPKPDDNLCG
jgi:hypothetical protein